MAKCKSTRATPSHCADQSKQRIFADEDSVTLTQDAIDKHWDALPPQAKNFILNTPDGMFSLSHLIKFWSSDQNIQCTRGGIAGSICGAAWYLALVYLKMHMYKEARALTINGSFIHQCYNSSIEEIKTLREGSKDFIERNLPYFACGFNSTRSADAMESFIRSYLPKEYTQLMTSFASLSTTESRRGYVDQISDDWKGTPSKNTRRSPSPSDDEAQIKISLEDDTDENERHSFDIGSSTTLKALFNDYADKRGVSLRSLRFSYASNTLFLSSAGHKTPEELGMQDQDVIMVHDTSKSQESDSSSSQSSSSKSARKKTKSKKRSNKKSKSKGKKPHQHHEVCVKTLQEHKVQHSKRLTKIHEEAELRFKSIRQRLNNLVIERSQPKKKSKRTRTPEHKPLQSIENNPFKEGIGGKAGKSHFVVQVGEILHLYKTTKTAHTSVSTPLSTLDLHGYTREEALAKLDESLDVWVDAAMRGSYPFVQPAVIVCGCGNQILSETVQEWIRCNDKVSNAPKIRSPRQPKRRGYASMAA